jgi:hypothetical protein
MVLYGSLDVVFIEQDEDTEIMYHRVVTVEYTVEPGTRGRVSGDPRECWPGDDPEFEHVWDDSDDLLVVCLPESVRTRMKWLWDDVVEKLPQAVLDHFTLTGELLSRYTV